MNSFQLKMIAGVTMVIDHIGFFFFPQLFILRIVGRLSFPLFAWFVAEGVRHTHNENKYLFRMFLFALFSQIPFYLANHLVSPNFTLNNAVFTLALGLAGIILIKKTNNKYLWVLICFLVYLLAELLLTDYGGAGALSVIAFYVYADNLKMLVATQLLIYGYFYTVPALTSGNTLMQWEIFGLLSLILIANYNHERGPKVKYFFYILYPLQYFIFYFLLK